MPPLHHPPRPCSECPWRLDQPVGRFPVARYESLVATSVTGRGHPGLDAPVFACHKTREGAEVACAGWLAVEGVHHVGMRLAVAMGRLDSVAFAPAPDWPPLYPDYLAMARANGAGVG